ncbi:MAG: enoyl-CoA hydratase/isomerase family protein [Bdellovibrio sp.]|nr:enoyl-CoA hydratase/isomerase family protein [Bdellovibrio sp.]
MIDYNIDQNKIVTLSINRTDTPMNVGDIPFTLELEKKFNQALGEKDLKGIILTSSKKEFMAGADLSMLQTIKNVDDSVKLTSEIHRFLRKMETSKIPVVAAINGTCLGMGYEIVLACHHRIMLNDSKAQIGLPEVGLGLLPGGGGTQRLPRLIGFEKALPYLLQGTKASPDKALKDGLVSELANDLDQLLSKARTWILACTTPAQPWDNPKFKVPGGDVQSPRGYQVFPASTAMLTEKTYNNYPAPAAILSCVYEGLQVPLDRALEIESKYFASLVTGKVAKGMIRTLFFGINQCNKGIARPQGVTPKKVTKVGILGAGMMGAGIAYVSAKAGIQVILKDVSVEVAEKGKNYSEKILAKDLARGYITESKVKEILSLITPTVDPTAVKGCDLVIEAVIEDRAIKARVTHESEAVLAPDAIFASNTSTLPITSLALESKRPANFIGLHFFSPVEKMPLIEIIMGEKSSKEALSLCLDYTAQIKKTPIVVNDGRGFFTSRVFTTYIEEGLSCLRDGFAPAIIENAGKMAGMPVGPLAVADEVGLDLIYHILNQTVQDLGTKAVDQGLFKDVTTFVKDLKRLGRKSGGGLYQYPADGKKFLWPELAKYFPLDAKKTDVQVVMKRLLYRQVLETIKCMQEKILTSDRDGDVGSILGLGFAPFTGGMLSFLDYEGLDTFMKNCVSLQKDWGPRFTPPKLLSDMASRGETFHGKNL